MVAVGSSLVGLCEVGLDSKGMCPSFLAGVIEATLGQKGVFFLCVCVFV